MATRRDTRGRFVAGPVSANTTRRINIKPGTLRSHLVSEAVRARRALPKAAMAAARRFVRYLADLTDEMGITDRGMLKNSWRAVKTSKGAMTFSDAPHAGVVELGARPHKVPEWVRQLLVEWAQRKLGLGLEEAEQASWGIKRKIETKGQEPTYLVRDAMPAAQSFFAQEFKRVMAAEPRPRVST